MATILFLLGGVGIGCFSAAAFETKGVLALGAARRNIAAALIAGGKNFKTQPARHVLVVAVVGLLTLSASRTSPEIPECPAGN